MSAWNTEAGLRAAEKICGSRQTAEALVYHIHADAILNDAAIRWLRKRWGIVSVWLGDNVRVSALKFYQGQYRIEELFEADTLSSALIAAVEAPHE